MKLEEVIKKKLGNAKGRDSYLLHSMLYLLLYAGDAKPEKAKIKKLLHNPVRRSPVQRTPPARKRVTKPSYDSLRDSLFLTSAETMPTRVSPRYQMFMG